MKLRFIKIASIIKTLGYRGDMVLKLNNNISGSFFNECIKKGNTIFISKYGIQVPFFISPNSVDFIDEHTLQLKIDGVNDLEKAKDFINDQVYFTENCQEQKLDYDLIPDNWINFEAIDKNHGFIGIIDNFENIPNNPQIIIKNKNKELMIPINSDLIQFVDLNNKKMHTLLPDGYLELFSHA